MPSVVNIATATVVQYPDFYDPLLRKFYGWGNSGPREKLNSIGSGIIIDEDGWILTNLHVVRRATRVQVKIWNGEVYEADPMVATEQSDMALIKLRLPPGIKLKAIEFADDDDLLLGETVLALGNPFGLGGTVTRGILSSKNRRPASDAPLNYQDWLQTDAAINPGNSGGPLINLHGELIGLNVAVYQEGQGIGFAIPVKKVAETLTQFFTPEVSGSLWFGARARDEDSGLVIFSVQPGSPAAQAGLQEGQEILQVNDTVPRGLIDFNERLTDPKRGRTTLVVKDGNAEQTVHVTLIPFDELISQRLGLSLVHLAAQTTGSYGAGKRPGIYITEVERKGPAAKAGLKAGQLLAAVGDREVRNILAVASYLSNASSDDLVRLGVVEQRRVGPGVVRYDRRNVMVEIR